MNYYHLVFFLLLNNSNVLHCSFSPPRKPPLPAGTDTFANTNSNNTPISLLKMQETFQAITHNKSNFMINNNTTLVSVLDDPELDKILANLFSNNSELPSVKDCTAVNLTFKNSGGLFTLYLNNFMVIDVSFNVANNNGIPVIISNVVNKRHLSTLDNAYANKNLPPPKLAFPALLNRHTQYVHHANQDKDDAPLPKKKTLTNTHTFLTPNENVTSSNRSKDHAKTDASNKKKPHKCNFCTKSFAIKSALTGHIRTHTGEKPFECHICNRSFARKAYLTKHIRTHTGEKLFKCHICNKGLSTSGALKDHLNKHNGDKPYQCTICTKAYSARNGLKLHMKAHEQHKSQSYSCKYCEATFILKSDYINHIRYEEEKNENRKCNTCQELFLDEVHLKRHNERVHPKPK